MAQRVAAEVQAGEPRQVIAGREVVQAVAAEAQGDERAASWQRRQGPASADLMRRRRKRDAVAVQAERSQRSGKGEGRRELGQLAVPQAELL